MQIQVTGKHIDLGDALTQHVNDRLEAGITKYFERTVDAHVTFTHEGSMFRADCSVHLASGMTLQAHAEGGDVYSAFDEAADKLEKRVRRYKRRLKNHHDHHTAAPLPAEDSPYFILKGEEASVEEPETLDPIIVAETTKPIRTMTVGEAVMQLDLGEAPALVFSNAAHGGINVVYRRADGHVGWIDPANQSLAKAS